MVYGENPIAIEFGVCLFDYVFAFFEEIPANLDKNSEKMNKSDKITISDWVKIFRFTDFFHLLIKKSD